MADLISVLLKKLDVRSGDGASFSSEVWSREEILGRFGWMFDNTEPSFDGRREMVNILLSDGMIYLVSSIDDIRPDAFQWDISEAVQLPKNLWEEILPELQAEGVSIKDLFEEEYLDRLLDDELEPESFLEDTETYLGGEDVFP